MSNPVSAVVNLPIEIIQTPRGRTITIEPGVEVEVTIAHS